MRLFVITVVLLSTFASVEKPQTSPQQRGLQKGETQPDQSHPNNETTNSATRPIKTPDCTPKQDSTYDPEKDSLYRWYLRVTIGGVGVGICGLIFLYRQHETAKKALMVSQRADVLVEGVSLVAGDRNDWGTVRCLARSIITETLVP